ncbi:hypothetical protein KKC88_03035, partial [Patescibacteria group bacterium]|nr:hypothetical protein [Patescibacteria group bacterium]
MFIENILIFLIFCNLALGIFVLSKNLKNPINITFFVFTFGLSLWTFSIIMPNIFFFDIYWVYVLLYCAIISGMLISIGLYYFSLLFPQNISYIRKWHHFYVITLSVIWLIVILIPNFVIKDVVFTPYEKELIPGFGFLLVFLISSLIFLFAIIFLVAKYRKANSINKKQILYILISVIILLTLGIPSAVILPFYGNLNLIWLGPISCIILISLMSYAILKYRLLDIKIVIKKSLVFGLTVSCLLIIIIALAILAKNLLFEFFGIDPIVSVIIIMALMILGLPALKNFIKELLDNIFLKDYIDFSAKLDQLNQNLQSETQLMGLAEKACVNIQALLEVRNVKFFSINRQENKFILNYPEKKQILKMENPFIKYF